MAIEKRSGDVHVPEVERDLPVQGASDPNTGSIRRDGARSQGVRKAGVLTDRAEADKGADSTGTDKPSDIA